MWHNTDLRCHSETLYFQMRLCNNFFILQTSSSSPQVPIQPSTTPHLGYSHPVQTYPAHHPTYQVSPYTYQPRLQTNQAPISHQTAVYSNFEASCQRFLKSLQTHNIPALGYKPNPVPVLQHNNVGNQIADQRSSQLALPANSTMSGNPVVNRTSYKDGMDTNHLNNSSTFITQRMANTSLDDYSDPSEIPAIAIKTEETPSSSWSATNANATSVEKEALIKQSAEESSSFDIFGVKFEEVPSDDFPAKSEPMIGEPKSGSVKKESGTEVNLQFSNVPSVKEEFPSASSHSKSNIKLETRANPFPINTDLNNISQEADMAVKSELIQDSSTVFKNSDLSEIKEEDVNQYQQALEKKEKIPTRRSGQREGQSPEILKTITYDSANTLIETCLTSSPAPSHGNQEESKLSAESGNDGKTISNSSPPVSDDEMENYEDDFDSDATHDGTLPFNLEADQRLDTLLSSECEESKLKNKQDDLTQSRASSSTNQASKTADDFEKNQNKSVTQITMPKETDLNGNNLQPTASASPQPNFQNDFPRFPLSADEITSPNFSSQRLLTYKNRFLLGNRSDNSTTKTNTFPRLTATVGGTKQQKSGHKELSRPKERILPEEPDSLDKYGSLRNWLLSANKKAQNPRDNKDCRKNVGGSGSPPLFERPPSYIPSSSTTSNNLPRVELKTFNFDEQQSSNLHRGRSNIQSSNDHIKTYASSNKLPDVVQSATENQNEAKSFDMENKPSTSFSTVAEVEQKNHQTDQSEPQNMYPHKTDSEPSKSTNNGSDDDDDDTIHSSYSDEYDSDDYMSDASSTLPVLDNTDIRKTINMDIREASLDTQSSLSILSLESNDTYPEGKAKVKEGNFCAFTKDLSLLKTFSSSIFYWKDITCLHGFVQ